MESKVELNDVLCLACCLTYPRSSFEYVCHGQQSNCMRQARELDSLRKICTDNMTAL